MKTAEPNEKAALSPRARMAELVLPLCRLAADPDAERMLVIFSMLPEEGGWLFARREADRLKRVCPWAEEPVEALMSGDPLVTAMLPLCRRYPAGRLLRALALDTAVSPEALRALLTADDPPEPMSAERIRQRLLARLSGTKNTEQEEQG